MILSTPDVSAPVFACDSFTVPDSKEVLAKRFARLDYLRAQPGRFEALKEKYKDGGYVEFVSDWGMMRDPRRAAEGLPVVFPFILFPRQEELLHWIHSLVLAPTQGKSGRGNVDKTRDCGFSWTAVAYAVWRFLFFANNDIGFGSNLERNVYDLGNPKSLFFKIQSFIDFLPQELQPEGWESKRHISKGSSAGKAINPENGSTITGDCGNDIGRGGRTLLYFVDEHASIERPQLAEAALSENTNTQINGSTHKGTGTIFYRQCMSLRAVAPDRLFEFDWRDDPRKDQAWYDRKKNDPMTDQIIFAQEVERDPSATIADGFISASSYETAMTALPADVIASGPFIVSVDVAAMGNDTSVVVTRRGDFGYPMRDFTKLEGDQLAAEVERICRKLLETRLAPLGAIIYELEGPGYGFHVAMKAGAFAKACRPIHPGRKLKSPEFYNERSRFWAYFKEWLEDGAPKKLPRHRQLKELGSALRYEWRQYGDRRVLLMEDKKAFKSRMAADPSNKAAGASPDHADAVAMGHAPVSLMRMTLDDIHSIGVLPDDMMHKGREWTALDSRVGY